MKLKLEDILKPVAKLEVPEIDFESPEVKALLERVRKAQEECRKRKEVHPEQLRKYVNI